MISPAFSIEESTGGAKRFLTPAEVARLVGVSATTVTRWAREGKLPCQVTLGGHRRFDPVVVEAHLRALPGSSPAPRGPARGRAGGGPAGAAAARRAARNAGEGSGS